MNIIISIIIIIINLYLEHVYDQLLNINNIIYYADQK